MRSPRQRIIIGEIMSQNNAAASLAGGTLKINIAAARWIVNRTHAFALHLSVKQK